METTSEALRQTMQTMTTREDELRRRQFAPLAKAHTPYKLKADREDFDRLDDDWTFRLAYVPNVLAQAVWDATDTLRDLGQIYSVTETRRVSNAIRELRVRYDKMRQRYVCGRLEESERRNVETLYDCCDTDLHRMYTVLKGQVAIHNPGLTDGFIMLITQSAYTLALIETHRSYCEWVCRRVASMLDVMAIGDITPPQFDNLRKIVRLYAGDSSFPDMAIVRPHIDALLAKLCTVDLVR